MPAIYASWLTCTALQCDAGGRGSSKAVMSKLVVDVREFMSPLPAVLHQQGLEVIPVTLEASACAGWVAVWCLRSPVMHAA